MHRRRGRAHHLQSPPASRRPTLRPRAAAGRRGAAAGRHLAARAGRAGREPAAKAPGAPLAPAALRRARAAAAAGAAAGRTAGAGRRVPRALARPVLGGAARLPAAPARAAPARERKPSERPAGPVGAGLPALCSCALTSVGLLSLFCLLRAKASEGLGRERAPAGAARRRARGPAVLRGRAPAGARGRGRRPWQRLLARRRHGHGRGRGRGRGRGAQRQRQRHRVPGPRPHLALALRVVDDLRARAPGALSSLPARPARRRGGTRPPRGVAAMPGARCSSGTAWRRACMRGV